MNIMVTASRIRSILKNARTEKDAVAALKAHRIKYSFSTIGGVFHIRIPARSGALRVYRTACKTAPMMVVPATPVPYQFSRPTWPSWEVDA